MIIVVIGVAGSGKTTAGTMLAPSSRRSRRVSGGVEWLAGGFKINASRAGTTVVPGMGVGTVSHG